MRFVLDASFFFFEHRPMSGALFTTPSVVAELRTLSSKSRYEVLLAGGLIVQEPQEEERARIIAAAARTGDAPVLSSTDVDVIALALELDATLVTDDFAVQNVALHLSVSVQPVAQRPAKIRQWRYRCTGCGRYFPQDGPCPICGAPVKRKLK
jgi:UPF0271 protein